jgi:hypothetical protein
MLGSYEKDLKKKEISEMTDRQIKEDLLLQMHISNGFNKRIMNNIIFFFWLTLIGALFTFIGYMNLMDVFKRM